MKKILSAILTLAVVLSVSTVAFAANNCDATTMDNTPVEEGETAFWGPEITYDCPAPLSEEVPEGESLLISAEEIKTMSESELANALHEKAPQLTEEEISQIVSYYTSEDFEAGIAPVYGLYDHTEWYIKPYIKSTRRMVQYATQWIGIDAYRSSVGMTKGRSETKSITFSLGYTGSAEIKKVKNELKASFSHTSSVTVSESQTCPAWTTMNWRPYTLFDEQTYYGKMKITTIIPNPGGVYQKVWYDEHEGVNKKLVLDTHEVWSRENKAKDVNARTPQPPTGKPNV